MTILALIVLAIIVFLRLSRIEDRLSLLEKRSISNDNLDKAKNTVYEKNEKAALFQTVIPKPADNTRETINDELQKQEYPEIVIAQNQTSEIPAVPAYEAYKSEKGETVSEKFEILAENQSMEFRLGGKIFTGIGALASTIGIGFFLRYAFENNLINETARCILGLIFGAVLLVIGEFTRKKFSTYSQILTGAGIGILYLSIYSAYGYYQILSQPLAFVAMVLITAIGIFLAVRYDSLLLAIFAQIGGFLTPYLASAGQNAPHTLFLYIMLLDLGIAFIAWHKLWRPLVFINFFGTIFAYLAWYDAFYSKLQFNIAEGYATAFFVIFLAISLIHYHIRKASQKTSDYVLLVLNATAYFSISYSLINSVSHGLRGFFTFSLAVLYLALAFLENHQEKVSTRFSRFSASVGLVLFSLAIPIQLEKNWITIGWASEALALVYIGFLLKSTLLRKVAHGLLALSFMRLVLFDSALAQGAAPWLNSRVLTFIFCIAVYILAVALYTKKKAEIGPTEGMAISFLALLGGASLLFGGTIEIVDFFSLHWLAYFWFVGVIVLVLFGLATKSMSVRILALIASLIALLRLFFVEINLEAGELPIVNIRFLLFFFSALSALSIPLLYRSFRDVVSEGEVILTTHVISVYVYLLTFVLFTAEITDFYGHYWLPIAWSLIAFVAVLVSLKMRDFFLRAMAYLNLMIVFFRLPGYESQVALMTYLPLFNSRLFAFSFSIIFLLLILIRLKKEDVSEAERKLVPATLFLSINFLLIWLLSVELWDYFQQRFLRLPEELKFSQKIRYGNLKNVSLSVGWTVYSIILLILGIIKKSAFSRKIAIFLLFVAIFKVFLFDTESLGTLYKFISFITLGIILLLTGFLYNQYKDRISQFIRA